MIVRDGERDVDGAQHREDDGLHDAPDLATRTGVRDRAMMHLCFAGGCGSPNWLAFSLKTCRSSMARA